MPEIRYYTVTQTREVRVAANNGEAAVRLASAAFEHGQNSDCGIAYEKAPEGVWGNTMSRIRETSIYAEEQKHG